MEEDNYRRKSFFNNHVTMKTHILIFQQSLCLPHPAKRKILTKEINILAPDQVLKL